MMLPGEWFVQKARLYAAIELLQPGTAATIGSMSPHHARHELNRMLAADVENGDPVDVLRQFADIAEAKVAAQSS